MSLIITKIIEIETKETKNETHRVYIHKQTEKGLERERQGEEEREEGKYKFIEKKRQKLKVTVQV